MINKPDDEQAQGRTVFGVEHSKKNVPLLEYLFQFETSVQSTLHSQWQRLCVSLRHWNAIAAIEIFNKKRKSIPMIDALIQFISIFSC